MKIQERTEHVSYAIRDIVVPARELEKQGHKILKLNIGDPDKYDFDTPEFLKEAAIDAIKSGKNFYGDSEGITEVKEAIVKREKKYRNIDVSPDNILPTAGGSEGINFMLASLVGPGTELLLPGPSYPLYMSLTKFYGATPVEYGTVEEDGWQPDVDDLRKKITDKTRVILVISPNNPTGAVYSKETLKAITDIAAEHNLPIIGDEIYDLLTFDRDYHCIASLNDDVNFMLIGGLSKVYFSPGWRAGYITFKGPDVEGIKDACFKMSRARLSINTSAHYAMKAAMENDHEFLKDELKKLRERRDFSVKRVNEIEGLSVSKPEGALYMLPKIEQNKFKTDKEWVLELLHKKHVLVVHGSGFGEYGKNHFRTVFLPPMETLENAFDKIEEFVKE